ncbi:MAG: hypothetical protein QOI21_5587 [Actinomycetota bacterium]|jgi:hypothetical protein|nr:hypothetical protein [Actinomycetota bacterium]
MFGGKKRARQIEEQARRGRELIPQRITDAFCEVGETLQLWDNFVLALPIRALEREPMWFIALTDKRVILTPLLFFKDRQRYGSFAAMLPFANLCGCDHHPNPNWERNHLPAHTLIIRYAESLPPLQFYSMGLPRNGVEEQLVEIVRRIQVNRSVRDANGPRPGDAASIYSHRRLGLRALDGR